PPCAGGEPILSGGEQFSGGTVAGREGRVYAEARTAFGGAISFQHPHSEALRPGAGGRFLELFRTSEHIAQAAEVLRVGLPCVSIQESVCPEHYRTVAIIECVGNNT